MGAAVVVGLELSTPRGELEEGQFTPGVSTGMLRGLVPPEVLLNQETTPDWLNHVTLGVPYDQELVESERLRPFGNIGLWAELSDDLGLQDFLPLKRNSPFRRLDPASLTVKGISALRDNNQTFVWTSHNDGQLLRHTLGGGLGAPNVRLVMPDEYVENCEPRASSNGNLLFSDIREIYIRGPHDGFALSESCAVLIWFDPNPSDPDRPHVSVFAAATLGEPWVEFGAEVVDYHIRVLNDEVWVANDGDLLRVRQPALQRGTN